MSTTSSRRATLGNSDRLLALATLSVGALVVVLWLGAALSAIVRRRQPPPLSLEAVIRVVGSAAGHPSAAWGDVVGPTGLYWACVGLVLAVLAVMLAAIWRLLHTNADGKEDPRHAEGLASRAETDTVAGRRALKARAGQLRPGLTAPRIEDLGHALGEARGVTCFATVEDSIVVLGPPRSGKGLHLVINAILDAPGGVITTSTRPDNLTACLEARAKVGPVAVFDPQGLAPGIDSATRWSPVRGCEDPHVAMVRAKALTSGAASGTTDANFWQASAEQAVRCLLHAAALARLGAADLCRWSLSALQAHEAVMILASDPRAATSWHQALESIVTADQRQRDSVWAMVSIAFSSLADPRVLNALTPGPGEHFDPEVFLRRRGTVFLVGTSTGASATAGIVGAFVEDVAEVARRMAARSPGARIDPPLSMILDEAANYPLPSLTSLMSEGGGTGVSTTVVLQSLAQARAVWGEHEASAIWDAAILKVILGGGSNARDLDDLSRLIGQRDERQFSESTGTDGRRSRSSSTRKVPILDSSQLRMLPFGTAVLIYRSARPIVLSMRPWNQRADATDLQAARRRLETLIQRASRSD